MYAKTKPPGFDSGGSHLRVGVLVNLLTGKGRPGVISDTDQMNIIIYQIHINHLNSLFDVFVADTDGCLRVP
jgi:hypothetical protein